MYNTIIIRYAEIALKKGNRHLFEDRLISNIHKTLNGIKFSLKRVHGRFFIKNYNNLDQIISKLKTVPGITSFSPAISIETETSKIVETTKQILDSEFDEKSSPTFKVFVKRVYKKYPKNSIEIAKYIADQVLPNFPNFKVKLKNPDVELGVEIYQKETFVFITKYSGVDGLPVGSSGKMCLLLSGGLDSPVAGYKMILRGIRIDGVYFHSPPYTSEGAKIKVIDLAKLLSKYQNNHINLFIVHFTDIQRTIQKQCKDGYATVLGRRFMVKIANLISEKTGLKSLITGDSIGQVASQTIENISAIDKITTLPILRPLIGSDKNEITKIAKNIGSFDISIRPYEDCCVVFAPKSPITKSKIEFVDKEENILDHDNLIKNSLKQTKIVTISNGEVISETPFTEFLNIKSENQQS